MSAKVSLQEPMPSLKMMGGVLLAMSASHHVSLVGAPLSILRILLPLRIILGRPPPVCLPSLLKNFCPWLRT